jgi:hypothetical protein
MGLDVRENVMVGAFFGQRGPGRANAQCPGAGLAAPGHCALPTRC